MSWHIILYPNKTDLAWCWPILV